jgi:hypothetical protein
MVLMDATMCKFQYGDSHNTATNTGWLARLHERAGETAITGSIILR